MGCCGSVDGWEEDVTDIPENREKLGADDDHYTRGRKVLRVNTGYSPADGWTFVLHDANSTYLVRATTSKENKKNKMNIFGFSNNQIYSITYAKGKWRIQGEDDSLVAEVTKTGGMTEYRHTITDAKGKVLFTSVCGMCCKDKVAVYRSPDGKVFGKLDQKQLTVGGGVNTAFLLAFMCTSILPDPM